MEYNQNGLLEGFTPGERVQDLLGDGGPDMGQNAGSFNVPNNPGPALTGRTPVVGSLRRSRDMPVLRDMLSEMGN